jgi:hypothetical protein
LRPFCAAERNTAIALTQNSSLEEEDKDGREKRQNRMGHVSRSYWGLETLSFRNTTTSTLYQLNVESNFFSEIA